MKLVCQYFGHRVVSTILNCASVHTQLEIVRSILDAVGLSARPSLPTLSTTLKGLKKHFVLILDEIDHLASKTNSFLYTTFQWPQTITAKLIVIGIANSIDLTERLLPKLKMSQPPKALVFAPYSKDEIAQILKNKLSVESDWTMDPAALELCSRKVAAMSGDLRTAFHVMKQTHSGEPGTPRGCRQVLGMLSNVYSSPLARARLPLQPRLLLAVAVAMSSNKSVLNVVSLTNAYSRACDVVKIPRLEGEDFTAALQVLESQSFIKEGSGGQLVLQVNAATAKTAIADNVMIAQVSELNL
uniref:ATPase_AAA_core domain-containing protein n=1 Tax=Angiostrongylus cantonensis TaxID=6313 RepID=A0A0K0DAF8_ANGCA